MRDFETVILGIIWGGVFVVLAIAVWFVYNLDLFPHKRLKNIPFSEVKIGQTFYDYGGERLQLREYIKTDEFVARCISISDRPLVSFDKTDIVKKEVDRLQKG